MIRVVPPRSGSWFFSHPGSRIQRSKGTGSRIRNQCCGPRCLSRILIFNHPGSRILDPKTGTKERGEKKIFCHNFFCSHKFHKIVNYFIFEMPKKKNLGQFPRIYRTFTQKIVTKLSKIWDWDPGSEIRDPEKTYSGSRGQKGTGSRIRIRNTG